MFQYTDWLLVISHTLWIFTSIRYVYKQSIQFVLLLTNQPLHLRKQDQAPGPHTEIRLMSLTYQNHNILQKYIEYLKPNLINIFYRLKNIDTLDSIYMYFSVNGDGARWNLFLWSNSLICRHSILDISSVQSNTELYNSLSVLRPVWLEVVYM